MARVRQGPGCGCPSSEWRGEMLAEDEAAVSLPPLPAPYSSAATPLPSLESFAEAAFRSARMGYDMREVDDLIDAVLAADSTTTGELIRNYTLDTSKPGYDIGEVDDYLDRLAEAVDAIHAAL